MPRIILDLRGLAMRSYFKGKDADAWEAEGEEMRTTAHTITNFLDDYLLPICQDHSIFDIIAVHEGGNQFRRSLFPGYKEKRGQKYSSAKSNNIHESTKAVSELLTKLGILSVKVDGVEADDVIAYLCDKLPGDKIVRTVDKDLIQLASESVRVFLGNQEEVDIVDTSGNVVQPKHIALYKSIVGDSSDEYPGVPGVGPAGYKDVFSSLNENAVIAHLERGNLAPLEGVEHPVFKKVMKSADLWKTCYQLAKLHPEEVERSFRVSGIGIEAVYRYRRPEWNKELPQEDRIKGFLEGHRCDHLLEDLQENGLVPARKLAERGNLDLIRHELRGLPFEPYVSIDFETASEPNDNFTKASRGKDFVDVFGSEIVSMGMTIGKHAQHTYYFTFDHKETDDCKNLPIEVLDGLIKAVPETSTFVAQNCMPGDVEVLTPQGWVELKDVTLEQEVMQWSPETGELSFVKPLAKIETRSDTLIKWDDKYHKTSYTPEHRMYVKFNSSKLPGWYARTSEDVAKLSLGLVLPVSGYYHPKGVCDLSETEGRLMEAIRADGCLGTSIFFCFKKQRKVDRLLSLLHALNIGYSKKERKQGGIGIILHTCDCLTKIKTYLGEDKAYGPKVMELSFGVREAILNEAKFWDGVSTLKHSSVHLSSVDVGTVDWFQILAHTTGRRFSVNWRPPSQQQIFGKEIQTKPLAKMVIVDKQTVCMRNEPEVVKGDFDVYCLTVPSGAFMVRSKGHVHITGNCNFERSVLLNTRGIEVNSWHDSMLMASYVDENKPLPEYMQAVYNRVDDDEDESEEDVLNITDPAELGAVGGFRSKARSGWDLKFMARRYLGYAQTEYSSVVPKGQTMRDVTAKESFHYGADDPFVTIHLYWYLRTLLEVEGTWEHVKNFEFPAACLIANAFVDGISLDEEEMKRQEEEDRKLLDELVEKMRKAIRENQTPEMVELGYANLMAELLPELQAKAKFEKWSEAEFTEKKLQLVCKLNDTITYADYVRKEKEHKFDITPGKLEAICKAFGLPILEDLKPETIGSYCARCYENSDQGTRLSEEAERFLGLLFDCSKAGEFTPKRRGAVYRELRDHCYEAWKNSLPDDKRYEYAGFEFNLGSPAQKKLLMYGMLNLPRTVFNPKVSDTRKKWGMATGPVQTNKEAISDAMANSLTKDDWRWQVLEDLTTAQRCQTRLSLFYTVWPLYVHPLDGNVHPGIRSVGTETHRPSGNNPNALQLPKRGDGKKVRKCIVPNRKFYPREEAA